VSADDRIYRFKKDREPILATLKRTRRLYERSRLSTVGKDRCRADDEVKGREERRASGRGDGQVFIKE
jgi:hypothetical protein